MMEQGRSCAVFGHIQGNSRYKWVTAKSGKMLRKKSEEAIVPMIAADNKTALNGKGLCFNQA